MPTVSILIASFQRPLELTKCLQGITKQTTAPNEIIVIWQRDDSATRDAALRFLPQFERRLILVHCPTAGIVPAENEGLAHASGEIVLLIDDDAVPPDDWLAKHLRHYDDKTIGAVGGPAINHYQSGEPFPVRRVRHVGRLTWYGKFIANLSDSVLNRGKCSVVSVDGLAGANMSLRRAAFTKFDTRLRNYWQFFELEACQQIKTNGLNILFDFENPVFHYPASNNKVYDGTRDGDLTQKFFNAAYNHAYILSKYTCGARRYIRIIYLFLLGSVSFPGLVKYPLSALRYGRPAREFRIMLGTLAANREGWQDGRDAPQVP